MAITWPAKNNYATGDVLTATNMNGIGDDLNALFDNSFYAGKNKIINGDFGIWQRGTSFTFADGIYTADRFIMAINSGSAGTGTVTQQTFTPATAPVAGYEGQYYLRYNLTATGTSVNHYIAQRIEDVRTFAAQTATFSFWGKADSARTITSELLQIFGSGGSSAVVTSGTTHSFTTSWQRFTVTFNVPSISGKTIGTSSYIQPRFYWTAAAGATIDTWGWQLEAGSTATPFQTATGTKQGELAACQRYFQRLVNGADATNEAIIMGQAYGTTGAIAALQWLVPMRTTPTMTISSAGHFAIFNASASDLTATAFTLTSSGTTSRHGRLDITVASGLVGGNAGYVRSINASSTMDISAEL